MGAGKTDKSCRYNVRAHSLPLAFIQCNAAYFDFIISSHFELEHISRAKPYTCETNKKHGLAREF